MILSKFKVFLCQSEHHAHRFHPQVPQWPAKFFSQWSQWRLGQRESWETDETQAARHMGAQTESRWKQSCHLGETYRFEYMMCTYDKQTTHTFRYSNKDTPGCIVYDGGFMLFVRLYNWRLLSTAQTNMFLIYFQCWRKKNLCLQTTNLFLSWQCWETWGIWSLWASVRNITVRFSTDLPQRYV